MAIIKFNYKKMIKITLEDGMYNIIDTEYLKDMGEQNMMVVTKEELEELYNKIQTVLSNLKSK